MPNVSCYVCVPAALRHRCGNVLRPLRPPLELKLKLTPTLRYRPTEPAQRRRRLESTRLIKVARFPIKTLKHLHYRNHCAYECVYPPQCMPVLCVNCLFPVRWTSYCVLFKPSRHATSAYTCRCRVCACVCFARALSLSLSFFLSIPLSIICQCRLIFNILYALISKCGVVIGTTVGIQ